MYTRLACLGILIWVSAVAAGAEPTEFGPDQVTRSYNVRVAMPDGVTLSTDIYRPNAPGKFPVVMIRTPYTKGSPAYESKGEYWVSHGYVLVVQDVRGRGDSDGEFYPLVNEASDSDTMLNWVVRQPWSSGKTGMIGGSYLGWTQMYAAINKNPNLTAIIPAATPPNPNRNFPVSFGLILPSGAAWLAGLDGHINQNQAHLDMESAYKTLPLINFDRSIGRNLKAWRDWVNHPTNDDYWRAQDYQQKLLETEIPSLHVSGWYDDVLVGTTENYTNLTRLGKANQHLLIGPWPHKVNAGRKLGKIDFGPKAVIDYQNLQRQWFDHWLKGIDNGINRNAPVQVFVMGKNTWINELRWPIARVRYQKFFLHSHGNANSRNGDGTLSFMPPGDEPPDKFTYDPENPVPYGNEDTFNWKQVGGPDDFSEIELRDDILVYSSTTLREPLTICGPLKVSIFAASSALDTDWTAKILDVHPNGFAQRLNDGAVRARFRNTYEKAELLEPGKIEKYDIDAWSTCNEFKSGHKIRLEISSSAFGKYDRNLNTGGPVGHEVTPVKAHQTVFHSSQYPSHVLLPVLPDS